MATPLDTTVPAQVTSVLATYGVDIVWLKNPNRTDEARYTIKGSPPTGTYQASNRAVSKIGNLMFVMAGNGLAFSPKAEDFVEYDGARWIVESVEPYPSGDIVAAYNVEIRKG